MKTGFKEHLGAAAIFSLAILMASGAYSDTDFLFASVLFVISSLIPDIDHPQSIPRRIARSFFFVLAFFVAIVFLMAFIKPESVADLIIPPSLALLIAFLLMYIFEALIPKHREEMHSLWAGLFLGFVVFLICLTATALRDSIIFGGFVAGGYIFHILVDLVGDRL